MTTCDKASVNLIGQRCRFYHIDLMQMIEKVHMLCNEIKKVLFGPRGTGGNNQTATVFFY